MLQYHHCRSLDSIVYGKVESNSEYADEFFKGAYLWLEKQVGFYPIFLAVGTTDDDIIMTGYPNQWRRILSEGLNKKEYRKKGEFPNDVLFSFENIDGVFMDFQYWHIALNGGDKNYQITNYEKKLIFKPLWSKSKWLRKAKEDNSVQLVTPNLYLPDAKRIWVRNKQTKELLTSKGFYNVESRRLTLK